MDIEEKTFNFALKIIQLYLFLKNNGEYVLSKKQFIMDEINYIVNTITKIVKTSQINLKPSLYKTHNSTLNTST
jgi:hypothetical protein